MSSTNGKGKAKRGTGTGDEKTILIVGVAGFIGSHLLEKIIRERTWNVIGVDMVPPNKIQQLVRPARVLARTRYLPFRSRDPILGAFDSRGVRHCLGRWVPRRSGHRVGSSTR